MLQIFPSLLTLFLFPFIFEGVQKLTYRLQNGKQQSPQGWHLPWAVKKRYFEGRQHPGKFKDLDKILTILSVFLIFLPRESIQAAPWSWLHKLDPLISGDIFSIHYISNIVKKAHGSIWAPLSIQHTSSDKMTAFGFVHWKHCRNVFGRRESRGEGSTEQKKIQRSHLYFPVKYIHETKTPSPFVI